MYSVFIGASQVGVPENFMNVALGGLYVYDDLQDGVDMTETPEGQKDAISLLYSDEEIDEYVSYPTDNQDGYGVIHNGNGSLEGPTWTLKLLMSGTFQNMFSTETG